MVGSMIAAAIGGSLTALTAAGATVLTSAGMAAAFAINFAVSQIVTRIFSDSPSGAQDNGVRLQVPPSAANAIPIVYGDAYMGGTFVDAVLSTDQQSMYYVLAVSCISPNGQFTFDTTKMYYGDRLITFDSVTTTQVIKLTDQANPPNEDTKISGNLYISLYKADQSGVITSLNGAAAPSTVMGGADIPAALRWTGLRGMNGLAFAIVRLSYSRDADTTQLQPITFYAKHYLNGTGTAKPGDVWYDYMTSKVYGGAVGWLPDGSFSSSFINSASATALNTYSDATITFTNSSGVPSTQSRYRINGVLDAGESVLSNVDKIVSACDSWMTYDAALGQWSVVVNKAETASYAFNDNNIIGDIRVSATDITSSINQVEAKFPFKENRDQPAFVYLETPSGLLYPNEPINKYTITYDMVNDSVQAQYLANRLLEQAREDLIVSFNTTYFGIQVDAGNVVSVTNSNYGWTNKLFRVVKVNEASLPDGSLGAKLELSEYSAAVYDDQTITQYAPVANSDLPSANYFSAISAPTVTSDNPASAIPNFDVTVTTPATGRITFIELYYSTSATPTAANSIFLYILTLNNGQAFANSTSYVFDNMVLPTGSSVTTTYYFSCVVGNDIGQSARSAISTGFAWTPVTNPENFIPGNMETGTAANAWIQFAQNGVVISSLKSAFNVRKIVTDTTLVNIAAQNNMDGNVTIWGHSANNAVGSGNATTGTHTTQNTFDSWQRLGALGSGLTNSGVWGLTYADNANSKAGIFERYSGANSASVGSLNKSIQLATASYCAFSPSGQGKIYIVDGNGPFTGFHEGMFAINDPIEVGDIVTDVSVFYRANISNVLFNVARSNTATQPRVLGVVSNVVPVETDTPGILWEPVETYTEGDLGPATTMELIPGYDLEELQTTYKVVQVNAVGEGQINVCGEAGDIQAGDFIVTSSIPGKGMKQSDNVMRSITVAKARESVTFSDPSEVKLIACIYLGG
jgi:hypothetical protein